MQLCSSRVRERVTTCCSLSTSCAVPLTRLPLYGNAAAEHRGGAAFADVSAGDNKWPVQCFLNQSAGFVSQKGWDPVTGLGNPNFRELLKFLEHMDGVRDARKKQKQAQEGEPDR